LRHAAATLWGILFILLFLELREAVATPTPETFWELLAVDPDLAKTLIAVILSQANHAPASYNFN
jgi:hypothetical protein